MHIMKKNITNVIQGIYRNRTTYMFVYSEAYMHIKFRLLEKKDLPILVSPFKDDDPRRASFSILHSTSVNVTSGASAAEKVANER